MGRETTLEEVGWCMLARPKLALVSLRDTALLVGCSLRTLQRYQRQGRLRFVQRGRWKYCLQEDIDGLLNGSRVRSLAAKLDADDAANWPVRKWFAAWVDLRREIDRQDGVERNYQRLLEVINSQQFGLAKISEMTVARLGDVLEAVRTNLSRGAGSIASWQVLLETPAPTDLDMLSMMPPEMPLLDALRLLRRTVAGVGPDASRESRGK